MFRRISGMVLVETLCIILFTLFSLIYLIRFQADLLAYSQNILSAGATSYNAILGGLIITVVALLLRFAVKRFLPKNQTVTPAISYLPSALGIAVLTSVHPMTSTQMDFGNSIKLSIYLIAIVGIIIWLVKKLDPFDAKYTGVEWFFRALWMNLAVMVGIFLLVGWIGNTNKKDHVRLRMERLIRNDEVNEAVILSKNNCENDSSMLMLRAYAFGKHRQLGSSFFTPFPKNTTSDMLFPSKTNKLGFLHTDKNLVYTLIGGSPGKGMSAKRTLEVLSKSGRLTKTGKQYLLTAYLLDRDLDSFIKYLPKVFDDTETLPRNIAEAVVLYQSKHPRYLSDYELGNAEERYGFFSKEQELLKKGSKTKADGSPLFWHSLKDDFGDTYWYYFAAPQPPKGEMGGR